MPVIIVRDPDRAKAVEKAAAAAKAAASAPSPTMITTPAETAVMLDRLKLTPTATFTSTTSANSPPASPLASPVVSLTKNTTKRRIAPPPPPPPAYEPLVKTYRANAQHDFEPETGSDELGLSKGECLDVLEGTEDDEGWVKARKEDGTTEVVPLTYMVKVEL